VRGTERDADNRSRYQQSERIVCDDDPEVLIDSQELEDEIVRAGHAIASESN
jgi:hypothetical protein